MTEHRHPYTTGREDLDRLVRELLEKSGGSPNDDLLDDIIVTAIKLQHEEIERGDLRMLTTAIKEMRYALSVFYPYRHVRKVALFGSARTPNTASEYKQAVSFARAIVKAGWMVVTGAASGIMRAGNEGAGRANSFGVNIRLPFEQEANPVIANDSKLINFKYFFTRKLIFIRESDATVLFPGGFGTHDEGFETMTLVQTGKSNPRPIVCIDPPKSSYWSSWRKYLKHELAKRKLINPEDLHLIDFTHSAEEAVKLICSFYRNYHSLRYIQDLLVMRIKKPLTKKSLDVLNTKYADILKKGKIVQQNKPFDEEMNEPHLLELTRLAFYFNRRDFAKLHLMIRQINDF